VNRTDKDNSVQSKINIAMDKLAVNFGQKISEIVPGFVSTEACVYVYIYVCIYIYMYVYFCVCVYRYICIYIFVYIHIYIYMDVYLYMYAYFIHICMYIMIFLNIFVLYVNNYPCMQHLAYRLMLG
jgi:hypothetical protein